MFMRCFIIVVQLFEKAGISNQIRFLPSRNSFHSERQLLSTKGLAKPEFAFAYVLSNWPNFDFASATQLLIPQLNSNLPWKSSFLPLSFELHIALFAIFQNSQLHLFFTYSWLQSEDSQISSYRELAP